MAKKGYKQTKEHIERVKNSIKKNGGVWNKIKVDKKLVIQAYLEVKSLRGTARIFNCSICPIIRILKENNIVMNNKWYNNSVKLEIQKKRMIGNKYGIGNKGNHFKMSEKTREAMIKKLKGRKPYIMTDKVKKNMREGAIKRIERDKFDMKQLVPSRGKYEKSILDTLEHFFNYAILRQQRVAGYFLDGYCSMLNLAIEVDEKKHKNKKQIIKDKYREEQIKKELECQFLRIDI